MIHLLVCVNNSIVSIHIRKCFPGPCLLIRAAVVLGLLGGEERKELLPLRDRTLSDIKVDVSINHFGMFYRAQEMERKAFWPLT